MIIEKRIKIHEKQPIKMKMMKKNISKFFKI